MTDRLVVEVKVLSNSNGVEETSRGKLEALTNNRDTWYEYTIPKDAITYSYPPTVGDLVVNVAAKPERGMGYITEAVVRQRQKSDINNRLWRLKLQGNPIRGAPIPTCMSYQNLLAEFQKDRNGALYSSVMHAMSILKMRNRHWPETIGLHELAGTEPGQPPPLKSEIISQFCHLVILLYKQFNNMCNPNLYRAFPWTRENRHLIMSALAFFDRLDYDDDGKVWTRRKHKRGRSHFDWTL